LVRERIERAILLRPRGSSLASHADAPVGRRALITGDDSGIGRPVAVAFAKEGADVPIAYLSQREDPDARGAVVFELLLERGVPWRELASAIFKRCGSCHAAVDRWAAEGAAN
jgi:NAD(P)-dependent dehydrogenase (short-subunit alcohol dehydrogenase family)